MEENLKGRKTKLFRIGTIVCLICVLFFILAGIMVYYLFIHRVTGQWVDVGNGVRIHYTDDGTGEPVVLVHGFAINSDLNWRKNGIISELSRHFRVIAMDLRGHGLSGKPHSAEEYRLHMVEDIGALLNHLRIENAHIVGYSLGGFVALKFARMHPDRVRTLSALGSGWEQPEESQFLQELNKLAQRLERGKGVEPIISHIGDNPRHTGFLHTITVKILTGYFNDPLALAGVLRGIPELKLTREDIQQLHMPICLIVGEHDPLRRGAERLKSEVPHAQLTIIYRSDHVTAPMKKEFIETLIRFLQKYSET